MAMDMKDMVKALATMPEEQRKTMMRGRLQMFSEMTDADRGKAMQMMMEAVGTLPETDIRKLIKTRTELLCDLPDQTRMKLMQTHMGLLQKMPPEKAQMEMKLIQAITPELKPDHQRQVMEMMKMMPMPAMGGTREREPVGVGARPRPAAVPSHRKAPWWKFWK